MSMEPLLCAKELAVGYEGRPLIRGIGLSLPPGRILVLIGPNGAGKSTILKTLTKALESLEGTVTIGARELSALRYRELARELSVVLTEKPRTELMTCREVVESGRYPYTGTLGLLSAEDKEQVRAAMELVHISELAERDFMRLSDGQRQRVLLARAICQQPRVLVLDEPTSFLDVRYELELLELLRTMARERGVAIVLSLHELDLAERIADDVLCVKGETVAFYGSAAEAFTRERIHALYELEGGDSGSYNPLFGSLELPRTQGEGHVFVIAGGGTGIPCYRALQKRRVPFLTGVLHENDVDFQVARDLAAGVIAEKAFEPISEASLSCALAALKGCDAVINCLREYGGGNRRNRELLDAAESLGLRVLNTVDEL